MKRFLKNKVLITILTIALAAGGAAGAVLSYHQADLKSPESFMTADSVTGADTQNEDAENAGNGKQGNGETSDDAKDSDARAQGISTGKASGKSADGKTNDSENGTGNSKKSTNKDTTNTIFSTTSDGDSLIATTNGKDVKVKLLGQNGKLKANTGYSAMISGSGGTYQGTDTDGDGIIWFKNVGSGSYAVSLLSTSGFSNTFNSAQADAAGTSQSSNTSQSSGSTQSSNASSSSAVNSSTSTSGTTNSSSSAPAQTIQVIGKLSYDVVNMDGEIYTEAEVPNQDPEEAIEKQKQQTSTGTSTSTGSSTSAGTSTDTSEKVVTLISSSVTTTAVSGSELDVASDLPSAPVLGLSATTTITVDANSQSNQSDSETASLSWNECDGTLQAVSSHVIRAGVTCRQSAFLGYQTTLANTPSFASVERNTRTLTASAQTADENDVITTPSDALTKTASVSYPSMAVLYTKGTAQAASALFSMTVSDSYGLITRITWASANPDIAKVVSGNKYGVTVTAVSVGETTITGTIAYTGGTKNIVIRIIAAESTFDLDTQLTDSDGNLLYEDQEGKNPATYRNYRASGTYYTAPEYTGWQTLDGKTYYFDANHNKLTGNQVIAGVQYTFDADGVLQPTTQTLGIDVSKFQGTIDWASVKATGIDFAIIRCAYRGYGSAGTIVEDPMFVTNIHGAKEAGLKVGVYFFSQAITAEEAIEEASTAVNLCNREGVTPDFPIFIDSEASGTSDASGRADALGKLPRTTICATFTNTAKTAGFQSGIYASTSWYNSNLDMSWIAAQDTSVILPIDMIWVAQYADTCKYTGKYDMWQYSSKGSVPGISGYVDMDIYYLSPKNQ